MRGIAMVTYIVLGHALPGFSVAAEKTGSGNSVKLAHCVH